MTKPQPIGACAILLNSEGKVLLGKRKNSFKSGFYGLPGGRIELNEPIAVAIQREVEEETSLKLNNLKYVGVVRENQSDCDFLHFVYVAKNIDKQPLLCEPEKCEGWSWVDLDSMDISILPGHLSAIRLYREGLRLVDVTS